MFGGLEVKDGKKEKDGSSNAPAGGSAFSGFSFLNSAGAAPAQQASAISAPSPAPAPAPSAFSFLSTPAPPLEVTVPKAAEAAPPVVAAATGSAPSTGSVFDFMATPSLSSAPPTASIPSPTLPHRGRTTSQESAAEQSVGAHAATAAPPSSFSFMDSAPPPQLGGAVAGSSTSVVSGLSRDPSFETPSPPSINAVSPTGPPPPAAAPATIAGAGVTFGAGIVAASASSQPSKVVKKRNRTARIGAAANAAAAAAPAASLPPPEAVSLPPRHQPPEAAAAKAATSSRESALEAARRAEEFLHGKLQQEEPPKSSSFRAVTSQAHENDEDSIVAAARAAAEEAQHLSHAAAAASSSHRSYFGGLFRARGSPPAEGLSYSSQSNSNNSVHNATPAVDRLQKEQEESKRAMAERQLKLVQQHQREPQPPAGEDGRPPLIRQPEEVKRTPSYTVPEPQPSFGMVPGPPELKKAVSAPARKQRDSQLLSSAAPLSVVAPSAQPKSPVAAFEEMQREFRDRVVSAMAQVTKLRQHRSGLLQERFLALAKERLATQSKSHAEAQQMMAAENEDFETADQMSRIIDAHERERVEISAVLENIQLALKQLEEQKSQVVQGVTQCFIDMQTKLKDFAKEQESTDSQVDAESMKVFAALSKQLSAENERLQHDWKHLERDSELVAEERKELEAAISEQAGEFECLRDDCQTRLKGVEDEIEELRKQLQDKQREAARLRTESAGYDESVLKVRVKFSRQLQRVQKKESTINDNREEWELEKKTYEFHREEHEAKVRDHSEALLAREQLLDSLSKEIELVSTFEEIVAKEIGFGIMTDADEEGDLAQLQADVVKCEAAVAEAKEFLKVASSALSSLQEEIEGLEARLPVLEQIKTDAATRRDFKGAAKASKEIKEASTRLKECKEDLIEEAMARQKAAEADLKQRDEALSEKRKIAHEQEREQSTAAMQTLADNIRRLIATKRSVCSDAKPNSVQGVGAFVLDSQIAALQFEGETYGDKYGGWDELVAEIAPEMPPSPRSAEASRGEDVVTSTTDECDPQDPQGEEAHDDRGGANSAGPIESGGGGGTDEQQSSKSEMYRVYRNLVSRLKVTEGEIESAAAAEDYEKAAELDEALAEILEELEKLNLTDEEMEEALLVEEEDDNVDEAPVAASTDDAHASSTPEGGEEADGPSPEPAEEVEGSTPDAAEEAEGESEKAAEEELVAVSTSQDVSDEETGDNDNAVDAASAGTPSPPNAEDTSTEIDEVQDEHGRVNGVATANSSEKLAAENGGPVAASGASNL